MSGIPAPWAWPKTLRFVCTIVIPSTSRDRSPVIHFRGVTLTYSARGLGLYFPKDSPKFANEKYQWSNQQRVRLPQSAGWGMRGAPLPSLPQGSPGCNLFQPAEGCGMRSVGIRTPGVYLLVLTPSGRLSVMHSAPTFKSCGAPLYRHKI